MAHLIGELSINLNILQEIYIGHDETLPECIFADLPTIKMAIVTLIEFGLRYSDRGCIEFHTKMKGYQSQKDYNKIMLEFSLLLSANGTVDPTIIFQMLKIKNKDAQKDLLWRFMEFYDLIDTFGLGLIIFPQIVQSLNGTIRTNIIQDFMRKLSRNSSSPNMRGSSKNKVFKIAF